MLKDKKGFVIEGVILIGVAAMLVGAIFWKPITGILGVGNQPQKQKSAMSKKTEKIPKLYYTDEKGNKYVAYAEKYEENTLDTSEDRQTTLWQKIKSLGLIGIILIVAFPGTIGAWAIKAFFKARGNITQLVKGIEEAKKAMPPEAVAVLENNLSKKADQSTKELVKKIKVKL